MNQILLDHANNLEPLGLLRRVLTWTSASLLVVFTYRLYQQRMVFRRLQKDHGITMLPHSFLFGHLPATIKAIIKQKTPPDLDNVFRMHDIAQAYPDIADTGVIYFDAWPLSPPLMSITNPDMLGQVVISPNLPKHSHFRDSHIYPLTGGIDVITADGTLWKHLRGIYNAGFSAKNLGSMTPWFMEEVKVFRDKLHQAADTGKTFELETWCLHLTFDVIARMTFDIRTRRLEGNEPVWVPAFQKIMSLLTFELDPSRTWNPFNLYVKWRSTVIVSDGITSLIHDVYRKYDKASEGPKTLVGLAIKPYVEAGKPIPPEDLHSIVQNVKMFLLAGHETTASTLARTLYFLSENPEKLARLRAELDEVFGPDPESVESAILEDYTILNKLNYAMAAVKETLRLRPPIAGTVRESTSPDHMLVNPDTGVRFPTSGFVINPAASAISNNPKYWHKPDEYIPERFLVRNEDDPLYPVKNAWLPFSLGQRACIGQEMVYIEIRLTLALVVRDWDFKAQYAPDAAKYRGEVAYPAKSRETTVVARTKDKLPVKVSRRVRPNSA